MEYKGRSKKGFLKNKEPIEPSADKTDDIDPLINLLKKKHKATTTATGDTGYGIEQQFEDHEEMLDKNKKKVVSWKVVWNGNRGCEVKKGKWKYTVNLKSKLCSCRGWQISGIPCAHACCTIWHDEGDPDQYLHNWFSPLTFMKSYEYALQPINRPHEWKKSGLEPILLPIVNKTIGRPKINRRKSATEPKMMKGKLIRTGMIYTCKIYGEEGHNKRICQKREQFNALAATIEGSKEKGKQQVKAQQQKNKGKEKVSEKLASNKGITITELGTDMSSGSCKRKVACGNGCERAVKKKK
ncbi:hypothetical protein PTKIN_Ptkin09bG0205400 [Pterospermum kingtungense]